MKTPPTEEVMKMRKKKVADDKIANELKSKKYSPEQINDAMQQASIKSGINQPQQAPSQPTPQGYEGSMMDQEIPVPEPPKEEPQKTYQAPPTQQPQFEPQQQDHFL